MNAAVMIDVIEKGTIARNFLKQMGISNFFDTGLTEVAINRPGEIWTEGPQGWKRHDAPACTLDACFKLGNALTVAKGGKLSTRDPIHPVVLPDGERGHVLMAPACERDTLSITIRIPSKVRFSVGEYEDRGWFSDYRDVSPRRDTSHHDLLQPFELAMLEAQGERSIRRMLELAVANRLNILIAGGTGSGKTTLHKGLVDLVPTDERIGTIQDIPELSLPEHPNHVHMFFSDELPAKELVRSTLRMKFDRVFMAELRGDEAWDYITLMNTDTPGGITTLHCNGARTAHSRIATLVKQGVVGQTLDWQFIVGQVRSTVDLVLYMRKKRLAEIWYDPIGKWQWLDGAV
ncbi:P-type DNA transfer ATPase VirB11 [Paraburkholderia sp. Ac-20340]|uniref:P-type DNA transfer ATPase VirB11 n=1 Tax=Paraburkholderia sp. Ac-20340 TaxID=2703888 RepID=UPI00197D375B|nr:P-type DNA transfer ATPase VirB11 [Paraburkholderia sp. Ac-20340]MBN3856776.1 P-type DNA transfer ATPase VirB11 [Paraburkholderia sp. Ac-20340]